MTINRTIFSKNGVHTLTQEEDVMPTEEELAAQALVRSNNKKEDLRNLRSSLLAESDWTQSSDSPLTDAKKTEWATYRTSLRDLPTHANWPDLEDDDWPTKPS